MDQSMDKVSQVGRDAKNIISEAANKIGESTRNIELPEMVSEQLQVLKEQSQVVLDRTEELVKKHPFYSVLGAAAVGAIVASLMSASLSSRQFKH